MLPCCLTVTWLLLHLSSILFQLQFAAAMMQQLSNVVHTANMVRIKVLVLCYDNCRNTKIMRICLLSKNKMDKNEMSSIILALRTAICRRCINWCKERSNLVLEATVHRDHAKTSASMLLIQKPIFFSFFSEMADFTKESEIDSMSIWSCPTSCTPKIVSKQSNCSSGANRLYTDTITL